MKDRTSRQNDRARVCLLDDDPFVLDTLALYLKDADFDVSRFSKPGECLAALTRVPADILITDLRMPEMDGLAVLEQVKRDSPSTDVIILSANADKRDAIQALRLGAFDLLEKPAGRDEVVETVKRTFRYRAVVRQRDLYAARLSFFSQKENERWGVQAFVGQSGAIKRIVRDVQLVQKSPRTAVLITGESGTGKELVARAIHYGSSRAPEPFVPINCSAVPPDLVESTLFGHVKGSFTGAIADRKGCFEVADGGTLFLDEIGDMPPAMQAKLLRVLEDSVITPVGSAKEHRVDVRILAATNADIERKIGESSFRADLYYRIAAYTIHVPPLRDRREEIPLLASHFASLYAGEMGVPTPRLHPAAIEALKSHPFPGNVRELKNVIERAMIESGGDEIRSEHVFCRQMPASGLSTGAEAPSAQGGALSGDLPLNIRQAEQELVRRALLAAEGNVAAASRLLGVTRPKLYRMMASLGVRE